MEGAPLSLEVIGERLRSFESRIRSNHDSLAKMREREGKRGEAFVRLEAKVDEQAADITEIKTTLSRILWGLFAAIGVGLMFVVAVATLIFQNL